MPAGENIVYWDGADDHGRMNTGAHGNYEIKGTLVSLGDYTARMLRRGKIDLVYELHPLQSGESALRTPDTKGQWLADHTPPRCLLYLPTRAPQLLIGSAMAEGSHGLVWVDAEGVKLKGKSCLSVSLRRPWPGIRATARFTPGRCGIRKLRFPGSTEMAKASRHSSGITFDHPCMLRTAASGPESSAFSGDWPCETVSWSPPCPRAAGC